MFSILTFWIESVKRIARNLFNKISPNSANLQKILAKAIAGTFSIRLLNIGLAYIVSILLARLLGADGYGSYIYALALVNFLKIPTMLGMNPLIIREVSAYQAREKWGLAKGIVRWTSWVIFLLSLLSAIVAGLLVWQFQSQLKVDSIAVILVALISLPLANLLKVKESQLHAFKHIVKAQLPEVIIRPILLISLLSILYFLFREQLDSTWAIGVYVLATGICLIVISIVIDRVIPKQIVTAKPEYRPKFWLNEAFPMLLTGSMYLINNQTDTLMLGVLTNSASVGIYSIANRGASLMNFVLSVFNVSLAPTIASLHAKGEKEKLQKIVTKSANLVLLSSLPIAVVLIFFGKWFLAMFGQEFVRGQTVLSILCIGKLINASTGAVALLLNMTGYQKYTFIGVAVSAVLNVILNASLIPQWGAEGAATATAISTVVWNILLVIFVQQRLKINMNPLSWRK